MTLALTTQFFRNDYIRHIVSLLLCSDGRCEPDTSIIFWGGDAIDAAVLPALIEGVEIGIDDELDLWI